MSDMAPDTTGIRHIDQARSEALFERALELATLTLAPGGRFVGKLFQGPDFQKLIARVPERFATVKVMKPASSRQISIEQYMTAAGLPRGAGRERAAPDHRAVGRTAGAQDRQGGRDPPRRRRRRLPHRLGLRARLRDRGRDAIERIARAKQMKKSQRLALICPDLSSASQYGHLNQTAFRLAQRIFPGPYTLVVPATREVPRTLTDAKRRTVGIRITSHPIASAIVAGAGPAAAHDLGDRARRRGRVPRRRRDPRRVRQPPRRRGRRRGHRGDAVDRARGRRRRDRRHPRRPGPPRRHPLAGRRRTAASACPVPVPVPVPVGWRRGTPHHAHHERSMGRQVPFAFPSVDRRQHHGLGRRARPAWPLEPGIEAGAAHRVDQRRRQGLGVTGARVVADVQLVAIEIVTDGVDRGEDARARTALGARSSPLTSCPGP
jgi:hypothetical protein